MDNKSPQLPPGSRKPNLPPSSKPNVPPAKVPTPKEQPKTQEPKAVEKEQIDPSSLEHTVTVKRPPQDNARSNLPPPKRIIRKVSKEEQQKKEEQKRLIQLENEKRERARKMKKVAVSTLGTILFIGLCTGGFFGLQAMRSKQAKNEFEAAYNKASLQQDLETFKPSIKKQVDKLADQAAAMNPFLSAGKIVKTYQQAKETLNNAQGDIREFSIRYGLVHKEFLNYREKAKENKVNIYAPELWKLFAANERYANLSENPKLDPLEAVQKLEAVNDKLRRIQLTFSNIAATGKAIQAHNTASQGLSRKEWEQNIPELLKEYETVLNAGKAKIDINDWDKAKEAYYAAAALAQKGQKTLTTQKQQAEGEYLKVEKALKDAEQAEVKQYATSAWEKIDEQYNLLQKTYAEMDYAETGRIAGELNTYIQNSIQKLAVAKAEVEEKSKELKNLYADAQKQRKYFHKNWPQEWNEITDGYRTFNEASEGKDYLKTATAASETIKQIKELTRVSSNISEELSNVKKRIEELKTSRWFTILNRNIPATANAIQLSLEAAASDENKNDLTAALGSYNEAAKLLKDGLETAKQFYQETSELYTKVAKLWPVIKESFKALNPGLASTVQQLKSRADNLWKKKDFENLNPLLKQMLENMPDGRFSKTDNGIVIDYTRGLMWISDFTGPGGDNGEKKEWVDANSWLSRLTFSGRDGWRLPTQIEAISLLEITDEKKRSELFPGLGNHYFWTSENPPRDYTKAYGINLKNGKVTPYKKQKTKLYFLPVRSIGN